MSLKLRFHKTTGTAVIVCFIASWMTMQPTSAADAEYRGFIENVTFVRDHGIGLSKARTTLQFEFSKTFKPTGLFSEFSIHGTLRGSYDAVYDLNDDEYGKNSGGPVSFAAPGNPAFLASLPGAPPFAPIISTNPEYAGILPPPILTGAVPLPGVPGGTISGPGNPNEGLRLLGDDVHNFENGGVVLAYPTRPCDIDNRGCIRGYMDADEDELRFPEFNDDVDFIRELYLDAAIPFKNGHELGFRIGRQQVVWGRTDLFRVLDVINPVD